MPRLWVLLAVFLGLAALPPLPSGAQTGDVTLGVLAFGGADHARDRWGGTADYLSDELGRPVRLQPLTLDGARAALEAQSLDFLLTNPGHYESLMRRHGLSPLLSLRTDGPDRMETGNRYGAVIFSRKAPGGPVRLADLRGARFGAVAPEAFGGWQLALHTFRRHGLEPQADFAELRFMGFPQSAIVEAVMSGALDAGTVRTGVLEAMIAEGRIARDGIAVLNPLHVPGFQPMLSTALVPEWLIAATPRATPELRRDVARLLLDIAPGGGSGEGWLPPHSLAPVLDIREALDRDAATVPVPRAMIGLFAAGLALVLLLAAVPVLRRAARGPAPAAPRIAVPEPRPPDAPAVTLTPREAEILGLVEQGQTSKEIARALSISPKTVEFHRHNLLLKFEAANMADLVHRAGVWRRQSLPEVRPT